MRGHRLEASLRMNQLLRFEERMCSARSNVLLLHVVAIGQQENSFGHFRRNMEAGCIFHQSAGWIYEEPDRNLNLLSLVIVVANVDFFRRGVELDALTPAS